jgi:purine-binding chemotaxis protein CheW
VGEGEARQVLFCRVGDLLCAFPLVHVSEITRILPVDHLPGAAAFVTGLSVVRGTAIPVIDSATLFGEARATPSRIVVVKAGERNAGLAVDEVLGVRSLPPDKLERLPPVVAGIDVFSEIGTLDGELFVVLQAARIVPPEAFAAIDAELAAP